MAKPKLALIPAAQGSKLFSVLPSSGVGDFDFSRSGKATRINSQGLIEEVANGQSRLNYPMIDGKVVGCPHHILEPSRINLVTYSEDFNESVWSKLNTTISSNTTISPDGSLNADSLFETTTNLYHDCLQNRLVSSGVTYTFSCFVKSNGRDSCYLYTNDGGGKAIKFNVSNGTIIGAVIGTDDGSKITYFGNGWYRVEMQVTATSTASKQFTVSISDNNSETISAYVGDPSKGIIIYGAQLEAGSYSTSYIPTNGEANGVTRSAETANGSGNAATFNDSEGVLMAEISALADDSSLRTITLGDNSSSNAVSIRLDNPNNITLYLNSGGASQCSFAANVPTLLFSKCLIKYKANDFSAWVNGFQIGTDTNGIVFPSGTLDRINFDIGYTSTNPFYGKTKQVQYYDSALTDSELEQLTSWTSFTDMAEGQLYTIE